MEVYCWFFFFSEEWVFFFQLFSFSCEWSEYTVIPKWLFFKIIFFFFKYNFLFLFVPNAHIFVIFHWTQHFLYLFSFDTFFYNNNFLIIYFFLLQFLFTIFFLNFFMEIFFFVNFIFFQQKRKNKTKKLIHNRRQHTKKY